MALAVNVDRQELLPMVADVIEIMFKPSTPFWTGRVMDVLFDGAFQTYTFFRNVRLFQNAYYSLSGSGIPIDCSSNSFKVKAICSVFEGGDNASIQPDSDNPTAFTFSFLGGVSTHPHNKSLQLNDFGTIISSFRIF